MRPTPVDRYTFTADEVLAAILPNVTYRREFELRIDADGYVVIDIVQQPGASAAPASAATPADAAKEQEPPPEAPEHKPERPQGQAEQEARQLCALPLFRAFLEVKTEEAALRILPSKCHVERLEDLDRTKSTALNLRYIVEEFEAWKIS